MSAANTGCPTWSASASPQPFATYEITVDISDDSLNSGSSATFTVLDDSVSGSPAQGGVSGPQPDRVEFGVFPSVNNTSDTFPQLGDGSGNVLRVDFSPSGNDELHIAGLTVVGRPAGGTGPDTCITRWTGAAVFNSTNRSQPFPFTGCQ